MKEAVKKIIAYLKNQEIETPSSAKDEKWNAIVSKAELKLRNSRYRKIAITISSAAAILLGVLWYNNAKLLHNEEYILLESIASNMSDPDSISEVTLFVAEDKSIQIEDESNIVYTTQGTVTINSEDLDKEITEKQKTEYNQLIVPKGKRISLTLSDNSKLWVNSGTKAVYPKRFIGSKREIFIDGEAYLEVSHNKAQPFIVRTNNNFEVEVLGTSFNICTYKDLSESTVVLVEGSVKVKGSNNNQVTLKPNELVSIAENNISEVVSVNAKEYVSWVQGIIVLHSQPLKDVVKRLSLYYGAQISIEEDIQDIKISGKLELKNDLFAILDGLANIAPISCTKDENGEYQILKQ